MKELQNYLYRTFDQLGLDKAHAVLSLSNRPDLCDYQCNGAMALAKQERKPPHALAQHIGETLKSLLEQEQKQNDFAINVAGPGFLNIRVSNQRLSKSLNEQAQDARLGCTKTTKPKTIVLDFGGPNVAKEMHIGHLRCAIIGESLQRIAKFIGHKTISDVHLGDWGLPYGKTILELQIQRPNLPFFKDLPASELPDTSPVTLEELNHLYRAGNERCKNDPEALQRARLITAQMQKGHAGYHGLWKHFVNVSVEAIKRNYERLDVHFDYWLGESDAYQYVESLANTLTQQGLLTESQNAKVIEVALPEDEQNPLPPLIYFKNDGAVTYGTTDLATIAQRQQDFSPDEIYYVVDQRQSLHFKQVFRAARLANLLQRPNKPDTKLVHIGYGTINGPNGKPLKTRDGEQLFLQDMLDQLHDAALEIMPTVEDKDCIQDGLTQDALDSLANQIAMAAIKFNDMKNHTSTDYSFDLKQCTKFEGKTGPYLQYAVARINSILDKAEDLSETPEINIENEHERKLAFTLLQTGESIEKSFEKLEPSVICDHAYETAQVFSRFYNECPILNQPVEIRNTRLWLAKTTKQVLELELNLLGIQTPHHIYTRKTVN